MSVSRLRKIEKGIEKLIKDLERGKYQKYGFRNELEAKPFIEYLRQKLEELRRRISK